jgi:hypothetical protein
MAYLQEPQFDTTRAWLLHNIHRFLDANLAHGWLDGEAFGWAACRDSGLWERLESGGDVRTSKMDDILAFIQNPVPPKKWDKAVLTPIKLTRRIYE